MLCCYCKAAAIMFQECNAHVYALLQKVDPKLISLKLLPVAIQRAQNGCVCM